MDTMRPNLNAIYHVIETWSSGVLSYDEIFERLNELMSPEHFVPQSELAPIGNVTVESQNDEILVIARRIEARLAALTDHLNMPLPDTLNPMVLSATVRKLLEAGNMIKAIDVHRRYTGCGLTEAKRSCDEYLRHRDKAC